MRPTQGPFVSGAAADRGLLCYYEPTASGRTSSSTSQRQLGLAVIAAKEGVLRIAQRCRRRRETASEFFSADQIWHLSAMSFNVGSYPLRLLYESVHAYLSTVSQLAE